MDNGRSGNGESGDVVKSTPTASELLTVTYFHRYPNFLLLASLHSSTHYKSL
jgi:hypothetical protein